MNAVPKPEHPESIYDHGVTQVELDALYFGAPESRADYFVGLSRNSLLADVARLYRMRGDEDTALKYISQVTNPLMRSQFKTRPCCAGHS